MLFMIFTLHFQLHLMKSLKCVQLFHLISFIMSIWVSDTKFLNNNSLTISKLHAACLYHKYFKNYKLLNI